MSPKFFVPGLLAAVAVLNAGCGNSREAAPFAAFREELPWPERASGCDAATAPSAPGQDAAARAAALTWVHRDRAVEAFCGCPFDAALGVDGSRCGYDNDADPSPSVVWHSVVPPSRFGVYRPCWERFAHDPEAATDHCLRTDPEFAAMAADLYNRLPAIGALAAVRSDHPFGLVHGEPRDYGACDFETQSVMGKSLDVEPPEQLRGDIARIYLYMAAHYGKGKDWKIKLSREQRQMYEKWAEADPVDDWERRRACRIAAIQGWANPYVK